MKHNTSIWIASAVLGVGLSIAYLCAHNTKPIYDYNVKSWVFNHPAIAVENSICESLLAYEQNDLPLFLVGAELILIAQ